jgi:hypothetical protein
MSMWVVTFTPEVEQHRTQMRAIMDSSVETSAWEPLFDELDADSLDVSDGALIFRDAVGQVIRVYGAGSYIKVERQE